MSMGVRNELSRMRELAETVIGMVWDGVSRAEIAGSIRRNATGPKDIEVVAIARHQPDLFGGDGFDLLNETLRLRVRQHKLNWRGPKGGPATREPDLDGRRFYPMLVVRGDGEPVPLDLFVVRPPAQWGAIFAIRTGPAEYAKKLVTSAKRRGLNCEDGRLVSSSGGAERLTETEQEFIEACGLPFLAPHLRR
jgi:DNA polymerase/3'-5' exonuclease PolX